MAYRALLTCVGLTSLLAVACGSRVEVSSSGSTSGETTTSTGAAGGSTSGTGTGGFGGGAGGSGGAGGEVILGDCSTLELFGPPVLVDEGFGYHQRSPTWILSSDDGAQATLVLSKQAAEGPAGSDFPISIEHVTLSSWDAFPTGGYLGPESSAFPTGGATFAGARSKGGKFALLLENTQSPTGGLVFSNAFVPSVSLVPAVLVASSIAKEALFATEGANGHLLGMLIAGASGSGSSYLVDAAFVGYDGTKTGPFSLGCASGPMHAGAVPWGDGWLVALSNGGSFGGPDCADPDLGWPDQVQIVRANGLEYDQTDYLGAPGGATDVRMAERSDGAWVVFGTPPGQVVNGMFIAARIDANGKVVTMFPVGGGDPGFENPGNGTLTATSIGDLLAVAWVDWGGDKGPFLQVKVFDSEGTPQGHVEIFPNTVFSGAPSLLGSPLTPSLVLAWSEWPDQGMGDGDKMRAVRIDCVGAQ